MNPRDDRDFFDGLRRPRTPASLEGRVVQVATRAFGTEVRPSLWDRLWTSVPLRVAWVGCTLTLLVAHAAVSLVRAPTPRSAGSLRLHQSEAGEFREILSLPSVEISPRAERLALEGRRPKDGSS